MITRGKYVAVVACLAAAALSTGCSQGAGFAAGRENLTTWGAKPLIENKSFQKLDLTLILDQVGPKSDFVAARQKLEAATKTVADIKGKITAAEAAYKTAEEKAKNSVRGDPSLEAAWKMAKEDAVALEAAKNSAEVQAHIARNVAAELEQRFAQSNLVKAARKRADDLELAKIEALGAWKIADLTREFAEKEAMELHKADQTLVEAKEMADQKRIQLKASLTTAETIQSAAAKAVEDAKTAAASAKPNDDAAKPTAKTEQNDRQRAMELEQAFSKFYDNAGAQKLEELARNRVQERILAASVDRCGEYKNFLKQLDAETNFFLGTLTTAIAGAGAIATGASEILSGTAAIFSGVRSEFNSEYFQRQTIQVITNGIDAKQNAVYTEIKNKQGLPLKDYPVEAAIKDADKFHASCSLIAGLEHAALTVARADDPGLKALRNQQRQFRLSEAESMKDDADKRVVEAQLRVAEAEAEVAGAQSRVQDTTAKLEAATVAKTQADQELAAAQAALDAEETSTNTQLRDNARTKAIEAEAALEKARSDAEDANKELELANSRLGRAKGFLLIRDTPPGKAYVLNMFLSGRSRIWHSRWHRAYAG